MKIRQQYRVLFRRLAIVGISCFSLLLLTTIVAGQSLGRVPKSAGEYIARGNAHWRQGNLDRAIADFTKAIELDPNSAEAFFNRGGVRHRKNDLAGALSDYSRSIELNPQSSDAYYFRGVLRRETGDFDNALVDFSKVIDLKPAFAPAYVDRCAGRLVNNNFKEAILDCNKGLSLDPRNVDAYYYRGRAHNGLGEWGAGIADLSKAIKLAPKSPDAYNHRAWTYLILNRYDLAYKDAVSYLRLAGATGENVSYVVLIAYFAKLQARDSKASAILEAWGPRIESAAWPYAAIRFLRREISEPELFAAATDKQLTTEARAYVGMNLLLSGQREAALSHLHWVRQNGVPEAYEYGWVTNALRREGENN